MSLAVKFRWSITTAQVVSHLFVIIFVTVALAAFGISAAENQLRDEIARKLIDIAKIAVRTVPAERLELIQPKAEGTRMVRRLQQKLEHLREASGTSSIEVCSPTGQTLLQVGKPLKIGAPCSWPSTLSAGQTRWFTTESGLVALASVPFEGGEMAAISVHSDSAALDVLPQARQVLYIIAAVDAFLAFLLSLLLTRWISRPLRRVVVTADQIGGGAYNARVEVPALRELSVLALSINKMAEQVEQRDRELKALAATVAHEVRNPLNSIKLLVSLLDEELTDAGQSEQKETVGVLHDEIARLSRFLTDFLAWSRPVAVTQASIDAVEPAIAAVRMATANAQEAGVKVVLNVPEPFEVVLDRERMEQSLLNVVLNAIQASSPQTEVVVQVERVGSGVRYQVMDRGAGIDAETKRRLFEPFFTTRADGSGLGLCNAQSIVAAHRGELHLYDRVGGGTNAVITIPGVV